MAEAEVAKLKARMINLENIESQKKQYERKVDDMGKRLRDNELNAQNAQKQIAQYQVGIYILVILENYTAKKSNLRK